MRFEYTGKNAWIYGTVEGWEERGEFGYNIICDGDGETKGYEPLGLPQNLMGGCQGMAYGDHTMTLYVRGGKEVQVWSVTVQAGAGTVKYVRLVRSPDSHLPVDPDEVVFTNEI